MFGELSNERDPWDSFPIDERGRPTTYLSFKILKMTFSEPRRWFSPKELSKLLGAKDSDTDAICRQLELADLVTVNGSKPEQYRYNLNSRNVDVQAGFEKFLVEVELDSLPVHLMLDYSPSCSFRPRSYLQISRPE